MADTPHRIRPGDVVVLPGYVDWWLIVHDIKSTLNLSSIEAVADFVNVPIGTLKSWAHRGSEPLYAHGEALLEVHRRVCGVEKTQLRLREFRERATRTPI